MDGVEIDPELTEIGRRWFDLRGAAPAHLRGGRAALPASRAPDRAYDLVMVDAYRQPYIPFYLVTREFFALAARKLAPGGVLAINVGHPEGSDRLERALAATLRTEFPRSCATPSRPPTSRSWPPAGRSRRRGSGRRRRGSRARWRRSRAAAAVRTGPAPRGGPV